MTPERPAPTERRGAQRGALPSEFDESPEGAKREVVQELVTLHARVLLRLPFVQLVLVCGLALAIAPRTPAWSFAGWAALTLCVEIGRAFYARALLRPGRPAAPERAHAQMVLMAAVSGASQGLAGVLFFPVLPLDDQALLGVVLYAIPAAGAAVSMSSRYIIGAFSVGVLVPASLSWGLVHPHQMASVLGLCVLYSALLALVAVEGERMLRRSIRIRRERDVVVRDLQRRNADVREAVQRAEQAAQARARVLAAASHDLRQPLHALSIYSAVLAAQPTPQTLGEVGRNIDQIVRSLGNLLGGLLDLSRLSAGNYVPDLQVFELDTLLESVCAEFDNSATRKGLALRRTLPPITVQTDATALARIVRNLLDNAIKYTEHGEVRLACSQHGDHSVEIAVRDTGKGIAAADQERVFEEFYQTDNPGRDSNKGVGLGLAIVQRLTELLGGSIGLVSTPGLGTDFSLTLSGIVAASPAAAPDATRQAWPRFAGRRIFVLDDELGVRHSMRTLLELWQAQVHTAANEEETHALFGRHGRPDLLLADLRLGTQEHGALLADRLRRVHGHFPVVIVTGETASEALREAQASGYALLQKPVAPETLRDALQAALAPAGG